MTNAKEALVAAKIITHFCNNEILIIEEDFENVRDPDEIRKYIVEAVGYARNASEDSCYLKEAETVCNAYLTTLERSSL